jgi:hypothetical protein
VAAGRTLVCRGELVALEALMVITEGGQAVEGVPLAARAKRYVPFALLLASYLALEYVVNSRSYLITEGHYRLGWHAVTHGLDYLITLSMGAHNLAFRVLAVAGAVTLLAVGTARVRFFVVWILVTIVPSSFYCLGECITLSLSSRGRLCDAAC